DDKPKPLATGFLSFHGNAASNATAAAALAITAHVYGYNPLRSADGIYLFKF
ncbi:hypothetical protein CRG98_049252, partial [Punica granatum]